MAGVTSLLSKELALLKIQIAPENRPFATKKTFHLPTKLIFRGKLVVSVQGMHFYIEKIMI